MTVQDLLDKVSEAGVGFYELKGYTLKVRNSDGEEQIVQELKIDEDTQTIKIKLK